MLIEARCLQDGVVCGQGLLKLGILDAGGFYFKFLLGLPPYAGAAVFIVQGA